MELLGLRVLLVDDAEDVLECTRALLEARGARVTACASPFEALALHAARAFDVVVSDLAMPDLDGCELVRRLRAQSPARAVAAVAITAGHDEDVAQRAEAAGFSACLGKPVPTDRLVAAILAAVGRV